MAVWQFVIDFVPKQFLLDTYGYIPETISLEDRKKGNYFQSTPHLLEEILPYLQPFGKFDESSWSGTRLYHGSDDHDAVVRFDEETGRVTTVSCRVDMRRPDENFLHATLVLATAFDWYLMARGSRRFFTPTITELRLAMEESAAKRFTSNPLQFLTDLSKEEPPPSWG
jgi:hypothetical protein